MKYKYNVGDAVRIVSKDPYKDGRASGYGWPGDEHLGKDFTVSARACYNLDGRGCRPWYGLTPPLGYIIHEDCLELVREEAREEAPEPALSK